MNQNIEIEFKNLLSEAEYKKLVTAYEFDEREAFFQENCYFDSKEMILKQHHMALRIRIKGDDAEMTLKSPYQGHLLETNHSLTLEEAYHQIETGKIELLGDIKKLLQAKNIDPSTDLKMITRLKTKRMEKRIGDNLLVLDQSWYADQVDYELEVESLTAKEGKKMISELMHVHNIPERSTPNKIARAINATQNKADKD